MVRVRVQGVVCELLRVRSGGDTCTPNQCGDLHNTSTCVIVDSLSRGGTSNSCKFQVGSGGFGRQARVGSSREER